MGGDAKQTKCPVCGQPAAAGFRPFCSGRCADVDLNRWLSGAYAIPSRAEADEDGDDSAPEGSGSSEGSVH
jgi:endogenous inhibitor of DNA gyrase (YacG/DUF329 family)